MNKLEDCICKGLLRKVEPSVIKAQRSIEEAFSWLREARLAMGSGALKAALSSVYLSFFHSARAILIMDGFREKSHFCIGVYLEEYARLGKLDPKWPTIYHSIRTIRNSSHYSFDVEPDTKEISKHIEDAESFIKRMNELIVASQT